MDSRPVVVGLGASAGGIDALRRFFEHVPADSNLAFVVILHLSPEHESRLAEVIQAVARIRVTQVQQRTRVEPNQAYVIPPSRSLAMVDGHLEVSEMMRTEERRAPIDIFFRTLAATHGSAAVGVVLSGTGADGSLGLKQIKEKGGVCFAQDPADAQYGDMPRNSIATGVIDHILPVIAIPDAILALRAHLTSVDFGEPTPAQAPDEEDLRDIFSQLRTGTGHDLSNYKRSTVLRRLRRRMVIYQVAHLAAYSEILRTRPGELQVLLRDLLISVTHFFRDRDAFGHLERHVIPRLFEGRSQNDTVRVWVPACATGEEAYSLAMLLCERAASLRSAPAIQVFASDIDARSITVARQGFYTGIDTADVSLPRLERFFVREAGGYRVRPELRQLVLFSQHDVIKDPPFSHLDLVSCRNLLIYLNRSAQQRVLDVMHFALTPGRFLFLGSAESVEAAADLFTPVEKQFNIFASRPHVSRIGLPVPARRSPFAVLPKLAEPAPEEISIGPPIPAALHHRLLEEYAPPSLVVNGRYEILHLSDRAGRYLHFGGGTPSVELLTVLRPELRSDVRAALVKASRQGTAVATTDVSVRMDNQVVTVNVQVRPVILDGVNLYLVLFRDVETGAPATTESPVSISRGDVTRQLEEELTLVRAQLRSAVERHELHVEEHRASLEEQHAMNEELRSSSEELETSREELQSLNEELQTVNQELKSKIDEQAQANDDMRNLVGATDIGTIFLDRLLRITLFTPAAQRVFHLIPSDRGRPLSDINSSLVEVPVQREVERVMDSLERVEREVQTREGQWLLMRIHPYRTADDRINGVVLTFVDVTERKLIEQQVQISEERLRRATVVENVGIMFFNADGIIVDANEAFLRITGITRAQLEHRQVRWQDLASPASADVAAQALAAFTSTGRTAPYEREQLHADGTRTWGLCAATQLTPQEGVEFVVDISAIKTTEERLHRSESRHRLIVENITEYAIFTMDERGHIDHWNPGAERMFGYSERDIVGRSASILFTPEDRALSVDAQELESARDTGRASDERWHLRRDGSRFFVSGVTTLLRDRDGRPRGYVKVARDLTDRKRFEDALQHAHDALESRVEQRTAELAGAKRTLDEEVAERRSAEQQIRRLLLRMLSVQEDERTRIARDLHDHVGQQLVALRLRLEALSQDRELTTGAVAKLDDALESIARLDRDVDFFTSELRPRALDDLGLEQALHNFVNDWSRTFGIDAEFSADRFAGERLTVDADTHLYRIAQEALNNVYKHAEATSVSVILERRNGQVALIIEDNGRGFEPDKVLPSDAAGMGLVGMRERAALLAGTVQVESAPGSGTTLFVRIPSQRPGD